MSDNPPIQVHSKQATPEDLKKTVQACVNEYGRISTALPQAHESQELLDRAGRIDVLAEALRWREWPKEKPREGVMMEVKGITNRCEDGTEKMVRAFSYVLCDEWAHPANDWLAEPGFLICLRWRPPIH